MSRFSFALVLVALGCVSKCQCLRIPKTESQPPQLESTKIINGVLADILEFPYVVSINSPLSYIPICIKFKLVPLTAEILRSNNETRPGIIKRLFLI